jgi:hypothetical protein
MQNVRPAEDRNDELPRRGAQRGPEADLAPPLGDGESRQRVRFGAAASAPTLRRQLQRNKEPLFFREVALGRGRPKRPQPLRSVRSICPTRVRPRHGW